MEKKLWTIPPVRVEEAMYADLHALAGIRDMSLSDIVREALTDYLRSVEDEYHSLHSIFAGRERRRNAVSVLARNDGEAA